jgi:hypothetical protein
MTPLTVLSWLQYAATGAAILQTLQATGAKMTHCEFGNAISLTEEGAMFPIRQEAEILDLIAAVDVSLNGKRTLPYGSLVNAKTGEPGAGLYRDDFLVLSRAKP